MLASLEETIGALAVTPAEKQTIFEDNIKAINAATIDKHRDEIYTQAPYTEEALLADQDGYSCDDATAEAIPRPADDMQFEDYGTTPIMVCSLCGTTMEALPELRHVCIKQVSPSIYL